MQEQILNADNARVLSRFRGFGLTYGDTGPSAKVLLPVLSIEFMYQERDPSGNKCKIPPPSIFLCDTNNRLFSLKTSTSNTAE